MSENHYLVLTGGIGGARLVDGLVLEAGGENVTAIVNTGDDFNHLGLRISPDIDTLAYTLAGLADPVKGWGRRDETWSGMETVAKLGGPDWFSLGDRDLALHLIRTERLSSGETLERITADLASCMGVTARLVPMSNEDCGVMIVTERGQLTFQDYFVRQRCEPMVRSIDLDCARQARPAPGVAQAFARKDLRAIIIAPSNPWLSIDPILAVPTITDHLKAATVPVIAVTPLPGGKAVKGPTAKIMNELGLQLDVQTIADHYHGLLDGIMIDEADRDPVGVAFRRTDTIMRDATGRRRLARAVVDWIARF